MLVQVGLLGLAVCFPPSCQNHSEPLLQVGKRYVSEQRDIDPLFAKSMLDTCSTPLPEINQTACKTCKVFTAICLSHDNGAVMCGLLKPGAVVQKQSLSGHT